MLRNRRKITFANLCAKIHKLADILHIEAEVIFKPILSMPSKWRGAVFVIIWKEDYTTGVDVMDAQHKRLLEIAGDTYELLTNRYYDDKFDQVCVIIQELRAYADYHFTAEEKYMESIGYKKLLSHKAEHHDFIEKVNGIDFSQFDHNQNKEILAILDFVVQWIEGHILQVDRQSYSVK